MSFIWPAILFFLLFIPLAVAFYLRLLLRRRRISASYGSLGFVQGAQGSGPGPRRHIPPILFLAGLAILVIAMARPETTISVPKVHGTVILAFDISGSMAADDLKPTRMDAAKTAAIDFIKSQPRSVQVGVVAFSDSGLTIQPPTNEQAALLASINRLVPQRGTSLGRGILASVNAIEERSNQAKYDPNSPYPMPTPPTPTPVPQGTHIPAVIILLTDGENNEAPEPLVAAQTAADRGVRIYTVGLGSPEGTNLHINGITVHTQLDEDLLNQISDLTGGAYYNAESSQDLHTIYANIGSRLIIEPEKTEVTSLFAGASILVLLIAGLLSMFWLNRVP
jgi:Ca-activated chloride channel homolog